MPGYVTSIMILIETDKWLGELTGTLRGRTGRFSPSAGSPDQQVVAALKRPMMAFLLGHLAGIATHVTLRPFVNAQVWAPGGMDRRLFEVQLDAQVARGYFKRKDLHAGQSW